MIMVDCRRIERCVKSENSAWSWGARVVVPSGFSLRLMMAARASGVPWQPVMMARACSRPGRKAELSAACRVEAAQACRERAAMTRQDGFRAQVRYCRSARTKSAGVVMVPGSGHRSGPGASGVGAGACA